ncbi:amidase family protein [Planotetraspora phitsanulokensis]|uniref:Amidase n=1 Tax=Planotetraspora phitsanulokensis TaxID=575192 RepID=A0A8J3U2B8_9ACTN|nr:amidase [Planotetraspora phitsanulokensis]GII36677.1 amidase [Planotetraspora phitsanulokensis]
MTELWELGAWDLAKLIHGGQASCREAVEAHLRRIDQVNPRVNAITVTLGEEALAAADAADAARARGDSVGPLFGVPLTVKENIEVAGSATTMGIVALKDARASADAPPVAELRAAGAIPIGRTNMPEFGMRWHTDNALHGATVNPWSAEHTPGGSSGGEAVAVATGMSPLGIGNDGAGSLRWPAQCCGVSALKPSLGRVAQVGERAGPTPFAFQLLGVHGPIARHVRDLRLAFGHMCGRPGGDPWYAPAPLDGPPLPAPLRVCVVTDLDGAETAPEVAAALTRAAEILAENGYLVEEGRAPALTRASEIFTQIMSAYGRVHREQPPVEAIASPGFVRFWQEFEPVWTRAAGEGAFDPMMERASIARLWSAWMSRTPLVLAPIRTYPAFVVGSDLDARWLADWPETMRTAVAVNLLGLPSVAVPVGSAGTLPQAVQIIGPRFREDLCLDAAAVIEAATATLTPIDPR